MHSTAAPSPPLGPASALSQKACQSLQPGAMNISVQLRLFASARQTAHTHGHSTSMVQPGAQGRAGRWCWCWCGQPDRLSGHDAAGLMGQDERMLECMHACVEAWWRCTPCHAML